VTEDRWAKSKRIFGLASELRGKEREGLLDRECGDDVVLREEIEELLSLHDQQDAGTIEAPKGNTPTTGPLFAEIEIGGEFKILRELGRGATGVVYAARQVRFGRDVAVKVMAEGLTTPKSHVRRFHQESRRAAKLNHAGIAQVYVDGQHGALHWFAMELVAGHDLATELRLQREKPPPDRPQPILPPFGEARYVAAAARLCQRIAMALAAAHGAGIVHRDVKPANILLQPDGSPKLVDFGIAREEKAESLTRTDEIVGTVHYMSPEQAKLEAIEVDHRTDVYSLGVVLYELLTHQRPYHGGTAFEVRTNIQKSDPPGVRRLNPRVPRDLATICRTAMAKPVLERYQSADELAADLERFLNFEAIRVAPPTALQQATAWLRRHRVASGVVVALGLTVALGSLWGSVVAASRERDELLASIRTVENRTSFDSEDATLLANARRACERLGDDPVASRLGPRIVDYGNSLRSEGTAGIALARQSNPPNDALALHARLRLERAAIVLGQVDILSDLPDDMLAPLVTVRWASGEGSDSPAAVWFVPLDSLTGVAGSPQALGTMPLERVVVPYGYGRIRVVAAGSPPREFVRMFERGGSPVEIAVDRTDRSRNGAAMIPVRAGTLRLEDPGGQISALNGRVVVVDAFLIDECEVSNADYRLFLDANPRHPRPPYWGQVAPRTPQDRLPVAFVSWESARDYAEWAGKRLPTYAEWAWAARMPDQRLHPWGTSVTDGYRGNTRQPRNVPGGTVAARVAAYLERAAPVRSHDGSLDVPDARTPSGMYHALGNVSEWTETLAPERDENGALRAVFSSRIVIGDHWSSALMDSPGNLATIETRGLGPSHAGYYTGFRCARTQ
jgi:serine/threonine protein kinase/formylglycine-generating enzyme required for sulfatase activity